MVNRSKKNKIIHNNCKIHNNKMLIAIQIKAQLILTNKICKIPK